MLLPVCAIWTTELCGIFRAIWTVVARWTGLWILYAMRTERIILQCRITIETSGAGLASPLKIIKYKLN